MASKKQLLAQTAVAACTLHLTEVPDEDALPFKSLHVLQYGCNLRVYAEGEPLHPYWNNCKCALKRAGFQPALLLGALMSNVDHGPYRSGQNLALKQEAAEHWVRNVSEDTWRQLQEDIVADRGRTEDAPETCQDLLKEKCITARGIFASCLP